MSATRYRFNDAELQPAERLLLLGGKPANLGARAFDMLLVLVERAGKLVSKDELLDAVWGKIVVEEGNLHVHMSALRKLLGADAIATVPGRGYRFTAPVEIAGARPAARNGPPAGVNLPERSPQPMPKGAKLLGREHDLIELRSLLGAHRLITLTGPGGIGKTRLAQALLAEISGAYADGAAIVELAPLREPALLPGAIAQAAELPMAAGEDAGNALAASLRPLQLCLLLDNAEHLAADVARLVQRLLAQCEQVTVIVTSQVPLKLSNEQVYRLGALACPPPDESMSADSARNYPAMALFCQRASSANRHFRLDEQNLDAVLAIVRALEGVALAIELAAARAAVLGAKGVAERLGERLSLLRAARSDLPERQQTLQAAMDWSYQLLDPAQRRALQRLAVCPGTFGLELASQLIADEKAETWDAIDALADLVDRSLVSADEGDPPRYRLLETPRAYALDRLTEAGEAQTQKSRHAHLVAATFEPAAEDCWTLSESDFVRRYEPELDNLRAALDWAQEHEPQLALSLSGASARLWRALSLHPEALRRVRAAIAKTGEDAPTPLLARALEGWAQLAGEISSTESRDAALRAIAAFEATADSRGLYLALGHLAFSYRADTPEARSAHARMEAIEDPAWPPAVRLILAKVAGGLASHAQDVAAARAANLNRLALAKACGSERDTFAALGNLADVALIADDPEEAIRRGRELLDRLPRRHGVTRAIALGNLLLALLATSRVDEAASVAGQFCSLTRQLDYLYLSSAADALALLAAKRHQHKAAASLLAFADAAYAADHQAREPNEARARAQAWALIEEHLAPQELRAELLLGAALSPAQACALAEIAAGTSFAPPYSPFEPR